jgi:hypothetical protein
MLAPSSVSLCVGLGFCHTQVPSYNYSVASGTHPWLGEPSREDQRLLLQTEPSM